MNSNVKIYFDSHPKADSLVFATDGACFFTKEAAGSHVTNLERKKKGSGALIAITRTDYNAWWKTEAPKIMAAAEAAVTAAQGVVAAAQAKIDGLPKTALKATKLAAAGVLDKAEKELERCETALEVAKADVEALD